MSDTAQYIAKGSDIAKNKRPYLYVFGGLLFAVFLVYGNSIGGELVGDGRELVLGNSHIRQPWDLGKLWTSNYWGDVLFAGNYRPFSVWTYALNYRLNTALGWAAESAWLYRIVNILLHSGVAGAVYLLAGLWGLGEWGKRIAAIAFAVHPLHVEAVVSVVGRAECLAALAGIGFLLLNRRQRRMGAGFILLLAMWSKESAIAFTAVALWDDWCWTKRSKREVLKAFGVYGVFIVGWLALRYYALAGHDVAVQFLDNPLVEADWATRIRTAIAIQGKYAQLMIWPFGYSSDYSHAQLAAVERWSDPRFLLPILLFIGTAWGGWRLRCKTVAVAWGSYWLLAAPTANVFVLIGTIMGERLAYAPSIMAAILWGWCIERVALRWPRSGVGCAILLSTLWCVLCAQRSATWQNREVYHRSQLRDAPASARAHLGMGSYYLQVGKVDSALYYTGIAAQIYPSYPEAQYNLGVGFAALEQWSQAAQSFARAVELNSSLYQPWYNLGLARQKMGDFSGAVQAYEKALLLRADDAETWYNLGVAQWQLGDGEQAIRSLRYACQLRPEWRGGWQSLAMVAKALNELEIEGYARGKMHSLR
jgi:hypothetical protein